MESVTVTSPTQVAVNKPFSQLNMEDRFNPEEVVEDVIDSSESCVPHVSATTVDTNRRPSTRCIRRAATWQVAKLASEVSVCTGGNAHNVYVLRRCRLASPYRGGRGGGVDMSPGLKSRSTEPP